MSDRAIHLMTTTNMNTLAYPSRQNPIRTSVAAIFWSPYLYLYVFAEIILAFLTGAYLQSRFLLYALDGILFFPIFAIHVSSWEIARLFRVASFWGIVKSLVFIAGILVFNDSLDQVVDKGLAYHGETLNWIVSGEGIIAHPEAFIPLHIAGMFRVILYTVSSCGLITLIGGSRELNVMNFHVAQLLQMSSTPLKTLLFGWPTWSLLRGWSYLALMISSANLFFVIVRRHHFRWRSLALYTILGLFGVTLDIVLKYCFASHWRILLLNSL